MCFRFFLFFLLFQFGILNHLLLIHLFWISSFFIIIIIMFADLNILVFSSLCKFIKIYFCLSLGVNLNE